MFKAAILDDYQNVASGLANLEKPASQVKFSFFCDHLFDENEIANRLEVFDIPLVNRERAPFLKSQLEKLPNLTLEHTAKVGDILATKKELFSKADFITIHMPLSDRSRGIVGAEEIKLMKSWAFLINTSRGPLVSETSLINALKEKNFWRWVRRF